MICKKSAITWGLGILCLICVRKILQFTRRRRLLKMIKEKRIKRLENLQNIRHLVENSKFDPKIVNMDFEFIRDQLQNDLLTPNEVLLAFQAQALKAQVLTNCIVEFLPEANEWAQNLTEKYHGQNDAKPKPPLYGIPLSVKECFKIKDHDQTIGFAQFINQPASDDCQLVKYLKELGAIPFALTNLPQCMFSIGCSNPIFGTTTNPWNSQFSSGGSSGGEGALIALRGSPMGIGTDIGGSVRIPAHCCGIYALKPTSSRISQQGRRGVVPGLVTLKATVGIMGQNVDALIHFSKALWSNRNQGLSMNDFDPFVARVSFCDHLLNDQSKLTIGYYDNDGFTEPVPACQRAVREAALVLAQIGHKMIRFEVPDISKAMRLHLMFRAPDNWQIFLHTFNKDIVDASLKETVELCSMPIYKRWYLGKLKPRFQSRDYNNTRRGYPYVCYFKNLSHFREMCAQLAEYRENFVEAMKKAGVTCLLCPVLATPAQKLGYPDKMFACGWGYSSLYNLLDFPAGVVPWTVVSEEDEQNLQKFYSVDNDHMRQVVKNSCQGSLGMPVGVQVVSLPYCEETCLRLMKDLESNMKTIGGRANVPYV